jgi:hypothetical protein
MGSMALRQKRWRLLMNRQMMQGVPLVRPQPPGWLRQPLLRHQQPRLRRVQWCHPSCRCGSRSRTSQSL